MKKIISIKLKAPSMILRGISILTDTDYDISIDEEIVYAFNRKTKQTIGWPLSNVTEIGFEEVAEPVRTKKQQKAS